MSTSQRPNISMEMKLTRAWPKIELIRTSVAGFVRAALAPDEVVDRLAIASAELLENALKFSAVEEPASHEDIVFGLDSNLEATTIRVANVCRSGGENAARLREAIYAIAEADSLDELYAGQLRRVFAGESRGTGLIRVGQLGCGLTHSWDGDIVCVAAQFRASDWVAKPIAI